MTVPQEYMDARVPPKPSAAKVFFDQQILPVAIDIAGGTEVGLARLSDRAGRAPISALMASLLAGVLLAWVTPPRRAHK